jgi:hypothetical protein
VLLATIRIGASDFYTLGSRIEIINIVSGIGVTKVIPLAIIRGFKVKNGISLNRYMLPF